MFNILITGANRGIGFAFVQEYLRLGYRVFATCRQPSEAHRLLELQQSFHAQLTILRMDVTNPEQINECQAEVAQQVNALHILINNAGILRRVERLAQIEMDDLVDSFKINAFGPVLVAKAFVPLLHAGAPSKLVNITMPTPPISKWPQADNQIYVSSRYALNALTKMMALELSELGITTIGLYPGYIQTDMNAYAEKAIPAEEGIPKAVNVIQNTTPEQNGLALLPDGTVYAW